MKASIDGIGEVNASTDVISRMRRVRRKQEPQPLLGEPLVQQQRIEIRDLDRKFTLDLIAVVRAELTDTELLGRLDAVRADLDALENRVIADDLYWQESARLRSLVYAVQSDHFAAHDAGALLHGRANGEAKTGCERTGDCPCDDCLDEFCNSYEPDTIDMKRNGDSYEHDENGGRWTRARYDSIYGKGAFVRDTHDLFTRGAEWFQRKHEKNESEPESQRFKQQHRIDTPRAALPVPGAHGDHRDDLRVNPTDPYRYAFVDVDESRKSTIKTLVRYAMADLGSNAAVPEVRFFKKCGQGEQADFSCPTAINGLCDGITGAIKLRHDMGAATLLEFLAHEACHAVRHKGQQSNAHAEREAYAFGPAFAEKFLPHLAFSGDVLVYDGSEDPRHYKHSVHLDAPNGTILINTRDGCTYQKDRLDWQLVKRWRD